MRAIFCGNFEYDAGQSDLERLFRKYGKVDRVDMKSGFAFVYMEDERDAEDAIRGLDRFEFGRKGRRLRVEWTKQERGSSRRLESSKKPASNTRPSKTLFVINFDPYHTRTRDLERHFDLYGKIVNIRIRRNFAFIQYESQDDATKALDATNLSKLMDRVITVEYSMKDDDDKKPSYGMDRERDRSPKRGYGHGRTPSPYARERGSPDYGNARGRRSPSPYGRERASPDYGHRPRVHSRSPNGKGRNSDYGRKRSPIPRKGRDSRYSRDLSSSPRREQIRDLSASPRRERIRDLSTSPRREQIRDLSPNPRRERFSVENGRGRSPPRKASPDYPSPVEEKGHPRKASPDYRSPLEEKGHLRKASPDYPSPIDDKDDLSPGEYRRSRSPDDRRGEVDRCGGEESPVPERSVSRSPSARRRSRS